MDLFKQIVPDSELHENYKRIVNNRYLVEQINKLSLGFGLERDGSGKFIKEFQSTFNSSLWEIYCFALFKDMGCDFDFRHERPDFILKHHSIPFNVECVITNPALNGIPEYDTNEKLYSKKSLDFIVRDQVIRLLNALSSKIDKYRKGYHDLAWVNNNPFIVAIHAFEQAGL